VWFARSHRLRFERSTEYAGRNLQCASDCHSRQCDIDHQPDGGGAVGYETVGIASGRSHGRTVILPLAFVSETDSWRRRRRIDYRRGGTKPLQAAGGHVSAYTGQYRRRKRNQTGWARGVVSGDRPVTRRQARTGQRIARGPLFVLSLLDYERSVPYLRPIS